MRAKAGVYYAGPRIPPPGVSSRAKACPCALPTRHTRGTLPLLTSPFAECAFSVRVPQRKRAGSLEGLARNGIDGEVFAVHVVIEADAAVGIYCKHHVLVDRLSAHATSRIPIDYDPSILGSKNLLAEKNLRVELAEMLRDLAMAKPVT